MLAFCYHKWPPATPARGRGRAWASVPGSVVGLNFLLRGTVHGTVCGTPGCHAPRMMREHDAGAPVSPNVDGWQQTLPFAVVHPAGATPNAASFDGLLTPREAAAMLRVGRTTLYRLANEHALTRVRIGRCARFVRAEVESFIEQLVVDARGSTDSRPS